MRIRALKYAAPLVIYIGSFRSFTHTGFVIFFPLIFAWVMIPLAELFIKPNPRNLDAAEEELALRDRAYDWWLYAIVILQYIALYFFLQSMKDTSLRNWEIAGRIWVMGLLCGTFGINVGHELGHRKTRYEQTMAKMLLLTSLYMHFFIEHNKGHHKRVATWEDPSSARPGESVYAFYLRSVTFSWISAWRIAAGDLRKRGLPVWHWKNQMLRFQFIQAALLSVIGLSFGWKILLYYVGAAIIGFLLLETVNYIEHYGLQRKEMTPGKYERAMPEHSWNSDHIIGRLMLFELSRHSDHHYLASRKYQVLRHHEEAPQMPTGYPGMMLLSLIPPLWFYVVNRRIPNQA